MGFFKKHIALVTFIVLPFLAVILTVEAVHHHDQLEGSDHCALCLWQQTGSQAPSTPAPPALLPAFVFCFTILTFISLYVSRVSFSPSGRSPPFNLL